MLAKLLFVAKEWLTYWLLAVDEHSLQSPFIFSFYRQFIKPGAFTKVQEIENIRKNLLSDHSLLRIEDFGAGSSLNNERQRKVSYVARTSSSNARFSLLLRHIITKKQYTKVLELGTSLGINTAYLANADSPGLTVYTIEGSDEIASVAQKTFKSLGLNNVRSVVGNIDEQLDPLLAEMQSIDLVYMDANHTYEATIRYFFRILPCLSENSIVVIDDIHWSPGMKRAWEEIKTCQEVTTTADLFDAGLLFFRKGLKKTHYVIGF